MDKFPIVTIFGGTGFIGSQIVRLLAREGYRIKIAARIPEKANGLKPLGHVGQIVPVPCNLRDPASIRAAVRGSDAVVNCIGILYRSGKSNFRSAHVDGARAIAQACREENVARLVHLSALGVDKATSKYAASKREGEAEIRKAFPGATILRPGVVFGADDNFFNKFARLARFLPMLPLIGGGRTKMQPVYVGDVARAALSCVAIPDGAVNDPRGKIFELGGPAIVDFREIYRLVFEGTGRTRRGIPMPFWLVKTDAFFLGLLPRPLLTIDQVESLKTDSVVGQGAHSLTDLGIEPTALQIVLPSILSKYRSGGSFRALEKANIVK